MLLKDVAKTFSISDIRMLEEFARYMAINIGNMLSYESISNDIKISFQTVRKYLDAMEKSYLLVRIQPFFTNKIKEITKRPKLFFVDTGMRNILTKTFQSEPDGKLFENYVLTELIKMGFEPKYWRTKSRIEVDFIIEKDGEIIPIEVKLNAKEGRIERGMRSFIETYKPKTAFVVSYHETKKETVLSGCRIVFTNILNLRKMLLKE
jgi:predicted AAA+ superfamily ATPase